MDENIIKTLCKASYEEKKYIYQKCFSLGSVNTKNMNDRLVLLSLLALVYKKMKLKNPNTTVLELLLKITGETKQNTMYYNFLESVAIISEDFSYDIDKIDSCGMKTSQEIINKIKEILNQWLPF